MSITIELTYDMSKALGVPRFEVQNAQVVKDIVQIARERFGEKGQDFEQLSRVSAVAVNGVLINYLQGMKTRLSDGDTVTFVKAAAGG